MKHKNLQSGIIAFLLSFCLGFAVTGCLLTGYGLRAEPLPLALSCLLISAILTAILHYKHWPWISAAIFLAFVLMILFDEGFQQQLISMIDVVCRVFTKAYDMTAPTFRIRSRYAGHMIPLLALHSIISYTCAYVLIKKQSLLMTAIPTIGIFSLCFLTLDSPPELPYLLLFLFTFLLLLMSHAVRRQDAIQGNRLTKMLAIPVALSLLLTLVLVPSSGQTVPDLSSMNLDAFWEWFLGDNFSGNGSGSSDDEESLSGNHLSLDDLPPRSPENTPVMTVTANFSGTIYLRAQDFDEYTGTAWNSSPDRTEQDLVVPSMLLTHTGSITIAPAVAQNYLYIPYYPYSAPTVTGGMVLDESCPESYTINCADFQNNWESQWRRGVRIPSVEVDSRYLSLPDKTAKDAAAILRQVGIENAADELVIVGRISDYVRNSATYDTGTEAMPNGEDDFAIWFLTEADTGYCIHYATAATVLLRAAGIPARYVEGYTAKAFRNAPLTVRDTQAHAWVEYYLDGAGWIILDPTNGSPDYAEPVTTTRPSTTRPSTTRPSTTTTGTQSTTVSTQTTVPTQSTTRPTATTTPVTTPSGIGIGDDNGGGFDAKWLIWAGIGLLILLTPPGILFGQYKLRRMLKKRKLHRGDPNTQALRRYKEAIRLSKCSCLSLPDALTALAEKAKFSQHTLTDAELAVFDTFFNDCAAAMKQKKLLRRFYLCFLRAAY